jgi:hypothetical protein
VKQVKPLWPIFIKLNGHILEQCAGVATCRAGGLCLSLCPSFARLDTSLCTSLHIIRFYAPQSFQMCEKKDLIRTVFPGSSLAAAGCSLAKSNHSAPPEQPSLDQPDARSRDSRQQSVILHLQNDSKLYFIYFC